MNTLHADIAIYTANPAGVCAAAAAASRGAKVLLLEQDAHIGGLNTSGLNNNEQHHMFPEQTFGGLTRQFFHDLAQHYPDTWHTRPGWFHSSTFERELLKRLDHPNITIRYHSQLSTVTKYGTRITQITLLDGTRINAAIFIDCSYEGDLLAAAGVSHHIGREPRSSLEPMAGVTWAAPVFPVSPYDADGLLPGLSPEPMPCDGDASPQVQNINYRITVTSRDDIKIPIPPPQRYNPRDHELLARALQLGDSVIPSLGKIIGLYPLPQTKFECNNNQAAVISISMRAIATEWLTASPQRRCQILADVREYNLGLMHFLATDSRVPSHIQAQMHTLGLPADEYPDNNHWPYEIYVREGRRMTAQYVLNERDIRGNPDDRRKQDAIALGSHFIDCHWVDRYPVDRSGFRNEGRLWLKGRIFEIPYRAILPRQNECTNLLVPCCIGATHVAFCAIRLEPTWMTLGESAAIAATLALQSHDGAVHAVNVPVLQQQLVAATQLLHLGTRAA